MKLRVGLLMVLIFVVEFPNCKSVSVKRDISLEKYETLDWQQKVEYFESHQAKKASEAIPIEVYLSAFADRHSPVTIAAIQSLNPILSEVYRKELYLLIRHNDPMVRWEACNRISISPQNEDLEVLIKSASDKEWMVRECVYSSVRAYKKERREKKYFYYVLSGIKDKNPNVLEEIYETLLWYQDSRAYPYMLRRSYHTSNSYELIVIMRQLVKINDLKVRNRLRELARSHSDFMVREEAKKILLSLYN